MKHASCQTNEDGVATIMHGPLAPWCEESEKCSGTKHCVELRNKLEECNNRVNSRSQTAETCVEELFDYLHALDHCVTEQLFSQLK
ncbi:hypothetical protein J6590_056407 [Homalodisca vitripennis]|nr:hypothetical protein J6590_056407 [Homalodisca vitripennis]